MDELCDSRRTGKVWSDTAKLNTPFNSCGHVKYILKI